MLPDPNFWRGKRVLLTGHTGFKGGWLSLWLTQMGATVTGFALAPEFPDGIYAASGVANKMTSVRGDIRDATLLRECVRLQRPEIVFHLAAQALVGRARRDPAGTYATNVSGTQNLLDATRWSDRARAVVVVTSDKVYENHNDEHSFVEDDRLGGLEPYGVSKAAAEMVTQAFRHKLDADSPLGIATVRAGNVIGGGDWAAGRLVPDAMKAFGLGEALQVRNPDATRPWQYVLEPLCGYLTLAERLFSGEPFWRSAWNFGPAASEALPVANIANQLVEHWRANTETDVAWDMSPEPSTGYEARYLSVDSTKAHTHLNWHPRMPLDQAIAETVGWYTALRGGADMARLSAAMISAYALP